MPKPEKLTVAEALAQAEMIDATLAAWGETAPEFVASLGGRDALARECEMTCIGPVPRLDAETWQGACVEWWNGRLAASGDRYAAPGGLHQAGPAADAPLAESGRSQRTGWRIWRR
jgi:hypothetical protein